jgi:hypothetical protein
MTFSVHETQRKLGEIITKQIVANLAGNDGINYGPLMVCTASERRICDDCDPLRTTFNAIVFLLYSSVTALQQKRGE